MRIELEGYTIEGTPGEMLQLLNLLAYDVAAVEDPVQAVPETPEKPKPKPAAKPASKPGKKIDWAKAKALRDVGWSYDRIGDELGVSGVTVSAHLKK